MHPRTTAALLVVLACSVLFGCASAGSRPDERPPEADIADVDESTMPDQTAVETDDKPEPTPAGEALLMDDPTSVSTPEPLPEAEEPSEIEPPVEPELLRPVAEAVARLETSYGLRGYLLVSQFHQDLADGETYTVTFEANPGREYVFVATACNGARHLAVSYDDALGDHRAADTRNSDAYLRPPAVSYPAYELPNTVRVTARMVQATRPYAVPTAILVFSRLR